jgi:hypothetical protein
MSITDYIIDLLLIVVIFRQVRPHELTARSALLPLILMAAAGIIYLRAFTLRGNDLALIVILLIVGIVLGMISGLADRIWRGQQGRLLAQAGGLSVVAWLVGMGGRFAFAYYAYHSGAASVASFSIRHDITGAQIWTTALVLMAFGQVLARVAVLQARRLNAGAAPAVQQREPALAVQEVGRRAERHDRIAARRSEWRDRRRASRYAARPGSVTRKDTRDAHAEQVP